MPRRRPFPYTVFPYRDGFRCDISFGTDPATGKRRRKSLYGATVAAVEEQGAATQEIARSVQQAAQGAQEVMQNIAGVREASGQVDASATLVLNAAAQLTSQSEQLETETGKFLGSIRAA